MGIIQSVGDTFRSNPTFFIVTMIVIFGVALLTGFLIWRHIEKKRKEKTEEIRDFFITKAGRLRILKKIRAQDWKFDYGDACYNIDKDSRLLTEDNRPAYVHIEGIAPPVNFKNVEKSSNIKIDAGSQKKILAKKLFDDLFSDDATKQLKDMILLVVCIISLILNLVVAAKVLGIAGSLGVK